MPHIDVHLPALDIIVVREAANQSKQTARFRAFRLIEETTFRLIGPANQTRIAQTLFSLTLANWERGDTWATALARVMHGVGRLSWGARDAFLSDQLGALLLLNTCGLNTLHWCQFRNALIPTIDTMQRIQKMAYDESAHRTDKHTRRAREIMRDPECIVLIANFYLNKVLSEIEKRTGISRELFFVGPTFGGLCAFIPVAQINRRYGPPDMEVYYSIGKTTFKIGFELHFGPLVRILELAHQGAFTANEFAEVAFDPETSALHEDYLERLEALASTR